MGVACRTATITYLHYRRVLPLHHSPPTLLQTPQSSKEPRHPIVPTTPHNFNHQPNSPVFFFIPHRSYVTVFLWLMMQLLRHHCSLRNISHVTALPYRRSQHPLSKGRGCWAHSLPKQLSTTASSRLIVSWADQASRYHRKFRYGVSSSSKGRMIDILEDPANASRNSINK